MPDFQKRAEAIAKTYQPPPVGQWSAIANPEHVQDFLEAIAAGNYVETAAELADLSKVTVYNWRKRAETGEQPYVQFVNAWKRAEAWAEAQAVANVRKAGQLPQFWAAEMTFLERRHPERWGRRTEEGSAPRVVVQIGIKDSDVQVQIASSESPSLVPRKELTEESTG